MAKVMTMDEIERKYDGEWVLIGDPEHDELWNVLRGELLWHSPDKDALMERANAGTPHSTAILFMGPVPDNVILLL